MKRIICSTLLAAAAALTGCDQSDQTGANDTQTNEAAVAPVVLPPSIAGSHVYRCKDNSLLYIDWYSDGSARVKATPNEAGTQIPAPAPDATEPPQLVGSADSTTITYAGKSCRR